MANTSILAAFERMWQHVTNRLSGKIDRPSAAIGSSTKPVYISSDGSLTEGDLYAGGTKVSQNGTNVTQANIYAPTTQATKANQIIYYDGVNTAPQWAGLALPYYNGSTITDFPNRRQFHTMYLGEKVIGQIYRPLPEGTLLDGALSVYNSENEDEEFTKCVIKPYLNNPTLGTALALLNDGISSLSLLNSLFSVYYRSAPIFTVGPEGMVMRAESSRQTSNGNPFAVRWRQKGNSSGTWQSIIEADYYGNITANGVKLTGGDYAEYLEWLDQNEEVEDRRGLFVSFADEGKEIKIAEPTDDIIGIVSAKPSVVGNTASFEWSKKYLTDAFGIQLTEEIEVPEEILENGTVIEAHTITQPVLNPDYDPEMEYIPRENRAEWAVIGFLGQLVVCDDGTCEVGKYCVCGEGGKATASEGRNGWRVLERIDESHIKVFFK